MRRTKKFIVTVLIITLILGIVPRQVVFAEELDPSPTPTPSASPESSPDPTPTPEPSPDPSPTPCPTDCDSTPTGEVDQSNEGTVDNTIEAGSDTGNNTVDPSPTPTPEPEVLPEATDPVAPDPSTSQESESNPTESSTDSQAQNGEPSVIATGDANAEVDIINLANTNESNSDTEFQIENVFGDQSGDITLVDPGANAPEPSLLLINQTNTATVTNFILVYANSGWNLVTGGLGDIQTGAAYATVNIINFINANLANSQLSFAIINIFGTLDGNIVLPEPSQLATLLGGSFDLSQLNTGIVTNNVTATSDTGNNSLEGGSIETGNAMTTANVINSVNSNMLGGSFYHLIINNYGIWNGIFAGWGNLAPEDPHYGHMFFDIGSMPALDTLVLNGDINQTNDATVTNTILAQSNTGNNTIGGDGQIKTGNAYTTVNLLNFINSNWAGVRGFFGLVNIFGTLNGSVGDSQHLAALLEPEIVKPQETQTASADVRSPGGALSSSMSTNVGTHVNPGDTVMFFITAQNTGTGPVYDGKVVFNLYDSNGELAAIQTFDFGQLNPGQKVKISFGAVLANSAPGGSYSALALASGTTGPDNSGVSSTTDTSFLVSGYTNFVNSIIPEVHAAGTGESQPQIQQQQGGIYYSETWGNIFFLILFITYIRMLQLLYRKDEEKSIESAYEK